MLSSPNLCLGTETFPLRSLEPQVERNINLCKLSEHPFLSLDGNLLGKGDRYCVSFLVLFHSRDPTLSWLHSQMLLGVSEPTFIFDCVVEL